MPILPVILFMDRITWLLCGKAGSLMMMLFLCFQSMGHRPHSCMHTKSPTAGFIYGSYLTMPPSFVIRKNMCYLGPSFRRTSIHFYFQDFIIFRLQRGGFKIWDASCNIMFSCRPFLALGTADGPGMMHNISAACTVVSLAGIRQMVPIIIPWMETRPTSSISDTSTSTD
jgi:hypothetical protein